MQFVDAQREVERPHVSPPIVLESRAHGVDGETVLQVGLRLGLFAFRHPLDQVHEFVPRFTDARSFEKPARVQVHVVLHAQEHRCVRR